MSAALLFAALTLVLRKVASYLVGPGYLMNTHVPLFSWEKPGGIEEFGDGRGSLM